MNKFFFGLALGCLVPVMSSSAWAGFQEGAAAYGKGDYQTALNEWLPMAQAGDAQAENAVGALYDNGLGVTSDAAEAFRWYSMAASQNYPLAMRNLGTMYATGHGVPYNLQQAQLWLGKAAGAGDRVAGNRLAALPPAGSTPADPVVTPLAATSSAVGTDATASNTTASGFGAVTGPSSLQAQPAQPANNQPTAAQASTTEATNTEGTNTPAVTSSDQVAAGQQTADATATAPAAPAAPATDNTGQTSAATPLTFPAPKPAETADGSTSANQNAGSNTATQVATATPDSSQATSTAGSATTSAVDATPGTVADGWHAFDVGDYRTALTIWQPLAQNGDSNLQVLVGSLYDYGQGVPQDKSKALQWYLLAAQKGSGRGQYAAGALLIKDAKQRNLVEAYKWLTIANDTLKGQGGDVAANQAMSLRQQISKEMSQDDIAKAETMAQGFHAG